MKKNTLRKISVRGTLTIWCFMLFGLGTIMSQSIQQDLTPFEEALTTYRNTGCPFMVEAAPIPPTCNGTVDGQACVTEPLGGVGPFEYTWVGFPDTDNCLENVSAGTYTCIITDTGDGGFSCGVDVVVIEPAPLTVFNMQPTAPSCFGVCDGMANPIVIGGNGGNQFLYDSGEDSQSATMLCNPFQLVITDSNGCEIDTTFVYEDEPEAIEIVAFIDSLDCNGAANAAIDITVTGGTPDYEYAWTGPSSFASADSDIFNLAPGTYELNIVDDNDCVATASYEILDPVAMSLEGEVTDIECAGDDSGAIDLTIIGGQADFDISWTGPAGFSSSDEDVDSLFSGIYSVAVVDDLGCEVEMDFEVTENPQLMITALIDSISCFEANDGSIDVSFDLDCSTCGFDWTGPNGFMSVDEDISGLAPGIYELTVTYNAICTETVSYELSEPEEILLDVILTPISCANGSDGSLDLIVTNGIGNIEFIWSGPNNYAADIQNITGLISGTYSVIVEDENGCMGQGEWNVSEPNPILISDSIVDVLCPGQDNGEIYLNLSGGVPDYEISWTGPAGFSSSDEDILGLIAGVYTLSLVDENGCDTSITYVLNEPENLVISDTLITTLLCAGDGSGAIDITIAGGTPTYEYNWNGPLGFASADEDISGLDAGDYNLEVIDDNGCLLSAELEVAEPDTLSGTLTIQHLACFEDGSGAIELTISGGTSPFEVDWSGPASFSSSDQNISGLEAGAYNLTITDFNDCSVMLSDSVLQPDELTLDAVLTHIDCFSEATGAIALLITNGIPDYQISWTGPNGFTSSSQSISNLVAGEYEVVVEDDNACIQTATYTILENEELIVTGEEMNLLCNEDGGGSIDLTVSGGSPSYFFSWTGPNGFASIDQNISGLAAGTYEVVVSDSLSCELNLSYELTEPEAIMANAQVQNVLCFSSSTGIIDIEPTGGTGDFTFNWTGPLGFTSEDQDITGLDAGQYFLTITDDNQCTMDTSMIIVEPEEILVTVTVHQPTCGEANGAVQIDAEGGIAPTGYDYQLIDQNGVTVSMSDSTSELTAGVYEIIVSDDNGCEQGVFFSVNSDQGQLLALIEDETCSGAADGSIDLTALGLTGTLDAFWSGPNGYTDTNFDINELSGGIYMVQVIDDLGCTISETYEVLEAGTLQLTGNVIAVSCIGAEDGAIDLTIIDGTQPFDIEWDGPGGFSSSAEDISGLEGGAYSVSVTDNNNCAQLATFEVEVNEDINVSELTVDASCFDSADGAITITLDPVVPGLSFNWTGPNGFASIDQSVSGLEEGTYDLIISISADCQESYQFEIEAPEEITVDVQTTSSSCGDENGTATISATGGTVAGDYNYQVIDLMTNQIVSNSAMTSDLPAGGYQVIVEDDNGCVTTTPFTISDDTGSVSALITDEDCSGSANGAIDVTIVDAIEPYAVSWIGPNGFASSTEDISNLESGTYNLTITDANGCVISGSYQVNEGLLLDVSTLIFQISCSDAEDGSIGITHTNGQPPFQHFWTGPDGFTSNAQTLTGLSEGQYVLMYSDDNGCSGTESFEILAPTELMVVEDIEHNDCFGESMGSIQLVVSGGAGNYETSWTGPDGFTSSFEDISGLVGGTYTLTLSDFNDCTASFDFEVLQPEPIQIEVLQEVQPSCDVNDGILEVQASGGDSPYVFEWTNSSNVTISSSSLISDLGSDTYTVRVTDESSCSAELAIGLFSTEITLEGEVQDISCFGLDDGSINLTIIGTPADPYTIDWEGPDGFVSAEEDISLLAPGMYTVQLLDNNNCLFGEDFEIIEPDTLIVSSTAVDLSCFDSDDGSIDITVSGGTLAYDFSWTGPNGFTQDQEDIDGLDVGIYEIVVTDDNGCTASASEELVQPSEILIIEDIQSALCNGIDNGTIDIEAAGGSGNYIYQWTGPNAFSSIQQDIVSLAPGTYTLTVTDDNECESTESFVIETESELNNNIQTTAISCSGDSDGSINAEVSGGVAGYNYTWTGPGGFTSNDDDISGLIGGTYILTVSDDQGCTRADTVVLLDPAALQLVDTLTTPSICFGASQGAIEITTIGGTPDYIYQWSGPAGFSSIDEDVTNISAGAYDLLIIDENGCELMAAFSLGQAAEIIIDLESSVDAQCSSSPDGALSIDVNGGSPNYSYEWNGPNGYESEDQDIVNVFPGMYTVTITDIEGCMVSETYQVGAMLEIEANPGAYPEVCDGTLVTLDAGGSEGADEFIWLNADGDTLSTALAFGTIISDNNNTFYLEANDGLCFDIDSVVIGTLPIPQPDAGEDITAFFEDDVVLGGEPTWPGAVAFNWSPIDDLELPNSANPIFIVTQTTTFTVTVEDSNGCLGTDQVTVNMIPNLVVPDGFSPNGDGFNDFWYFGNANRFPNLTVKIFNRWGDEIFDGQGEEFFWDGKFQDVDVPVGTYYYAIELNDPLFPEPLTGPLTIFR